MRTMLQRAVRIYGRHNRQGKADHIAALISATGVQTVAIVGVGGTGANVQVVELAVSRQARIIAALDVWDMKAPWPYVKGDGCSLPWRSHCVDLVISNAVIEHVGDEARQRRFVAEQLRVARWAVVTTPNRWFPIESHTATALRHWSAGWRAKRTEFTRLLSLGEFKAILPAGSQVIGHRWSPTFMALLDSAVDGHEDYPAER